MTCIIDPVRDLEFCCQVASKLATSNNNVLAPKPSFPFVNRGTAIVPASGDPKDAVSGSIPWRAKGFVLSLPSAEKLAVIFQRNPNKRTEFIKFVAGALLHELIHFRQAGHCAHRADASSATSPSPSSPSLDLLKGYYQDNREKEAHAAQIAFLLGPSGKSRTNIDDVFRLNAVGTRISSRLDSLRSSASASEYVEFQRSFVELVERWRQRLFPGWLGRLLWTARRTVGDLCARRTE